LLRDCENSIHPIFNFDDNRSLFVIKPTFTRSFKATTPIL
jgi:hypothetical protein